MGFISTWVVERMGSGGDRRLGGWTRQVVAREGFGFGNLLVCCVIVKAHTDVVGEFFGTRMPQDRNLDV